MRELSSIELSLVGGGSTESFVSSIAIGTGAGSAYGTLMTNTMAGASRGGAAGAALGFAWGVGTVTGNWIYNTFLS
ncbi:MAG: hypothetical protein LC632_02300 [Xanthomonadaceae bacterium]|nr:hypothetical protein [Xanthomonadaceae bacterium]